MGRGTPDFDKGVHLAKGLIDRITVDDGGAKRDLLTHAIAIPGTSVPAYVSAKISVAYENEGGDFVRRRIDASDFHAVAGSVGLDVPDFKIGLMLPDREH